jgi:hypothetical protein
LQAKTQTLKMTIVSGLRIIDSNAQTGITWWNWTDICFLSNVPTLGRWISGRLGNVSTLGVDPYLSFLFLI